MAKLVTLDHNKDQRVFDAVHIMLGSLIQIWAKIDVYSSGLLCSLVKLDPVEFSTLVGRLDLDAKLQRAHKILIHRKQKKKAQKIKEIIKLVEKVRPVRNAFAHGYFNGLTNVGYNFVLFSDFEISGNSPSSTKGMTVTLERAVECHRDLVKVMKTMFSVFAHDKLNELFALPVQWHLHRDQGLPPLPIARPTRRRSSPGKSQLRRPVRRGA
ncbi:MAG: hypothetical protein ACKVP5_15115 [Aestuariivirga sp.]